MKVNDKGNYDCIMTFVLVKKEILENCKKVLFVLYSNMSRKIFDLNIQKYQNEEDDFCHCYTKDMQEKSGILISSFWYNPKKREDDELILPENLNNDMKLNEVNEVKNEIEEKEKEKENLEDFDENTFYKEIVRIGLNIK